MMLYARIDLHKTFYRMISTSKMILPSENIEQLNSLYKKYCQHKKFKSVMPIFDSEYTDPSNRIHGYYDPDDLDKLIAFSLIRIYDNENAEAIQFAWDYKTPEYNLGIRSLAHECAFYKAAGFRYLYLGGADEYKKQFDGFEILGPA